MTAQTTNRKYDYPITTDRPQDSPLTIAQSVAKFEADLLYLDSEYRRFDKFPLAIVETTAPQVRTGNTDDAIKWDAVVVDTWGMVNLGKAPTLVTSPKDVPGWYLMGGILLAGAINGDAQLTMLFQGTNGDSTAWVLANDTDAAINGWGWQATNGTYPVVSSMTPMSNGPTGTTVTVKYARMWMFWIRDW